MNFEPNFEAKFNEYCKNNGLMVVWYRDYDKMITTNNIEAVTAFTFLNPHKTIKLPKTKPIDLQYIIDKLEQKSIYNNLSKYLNKFFNYFGTIYPTSYGIGVMRFFTDVSKASAKIANWLNENNIEYSNEYSDAGWVYRFKISKSQENIKKLQSITNFK